MIKMSTRQDPLDPSLPGAVVVSVHASDSPAPRELQRSSRNTS